MDRYEEAHTSMVEALAKDEKDASTLINMIACCQHQSKTQAMAEKYIK